MTQVYSSKQKKPRYYKIREYKDITDRAYICDSYLKALRRCDGYDSLPTDVFYSMYRSKAEDSTDVFDCEVAYLSDEDGEISDNSYIFGFLQYLWADDDTLVLGFGYVRDLYRGTGVARSLFDSICEKDARPKYVLISYGNNAITESLLDKYEETTRVPELMFFEETGQDVDDRNNIIIENAKRTIDRKKLIWRERKVGQSDY